MHTRGGAVPPQFLLFRTKAVKPPLRQTESDVEDALPSFSLSDCARTKGAADVCRDHLLTGVVWSAVPDCPEGPVEGDNVIGVEDIVCTCGLPGKCVGYVLANLEAVICCQLARDYG